MPDKIEINVKINDKPATLADVSLETLTRMRDATESKPIKHGDYGYVRGAKKYSEIKYRFFYVPDDAAFIEVYNKWGCLVVRHPVDGPCHRDLYAITGNIFRDLQKVD